MSVISACATNEIQLGSTLDERTNFAAKSVKLVAAQSVDWCSAELTCKYIGETHCGSGSEYAVNECNAKISVQVIQAGGDTYVSQAAGVIPGTSNVYEETGYYRTYGKIYNCSGKFKEVYSEYSEANPALVKTNLDVRSLDYFRQCKFQKQCKPVISQTCGTNRKNPYKFCNSKLGKIAKIKEFNTVILQQEMFTNRGIYRVYFQGYSCK